MHAVSLGIDYGRFCACLPYLCCFGGTCNKWHHTCKFNWIEFQLTPDSCYWAVRSSHSTQIMHIQIRTGNNNWSCRTVFLQVFYRYLSRWHLLLQAGGYIPVDRQLSVQSIKRLFEAQRTRWIASFIEQTVTKGNYHHSVKWLWRVTLRLFN